MVSYETTKAGKNVSRTEVFTSGLMQLPVAGGMVDQPHRLMSFFQEFLAADKRIFGK